VRISPLHHSLTLYEFEREECQSYPLAHGIYHPNIRTQVHRDPKHWPNPSKFDPSRFAKKPRAGTFKPFSGGARSCLGQHYAELVYTFAIATLFQEFDFQVPKDFKFELIFNGFGWAAGGRRHGDRSSEVESVVPMYVSERRGRAMM